jgi:hypothetical protein
MKKLNEYTTSGSVCGGGYNKPVSTIIKRTLINTSANTTACPCKNLPGKVTCGICNPKRK